MLRASGIDVYQIDHEDANGQFEINYTYTDCVTSCDHYIFFKMAASEIANEMGLVCSFMPKPFANRPGLNVLIGGVPNGSGSGPNRVLVWARGDRYGVIEAWDAVEAAKAARGDAIRGFFAKLHGGR